jgi:DNA primase small subunit
LDENSAQIVGRYFREYYFTFGERIKAPSDIASREFGYFPFGGAMIRHLSFTDIRSFRALLVKEGPAGVYCSNSHYTDPSAEMASKGWLRAELIFDIDADALKQPCKEVHDIWLCKNCGKKEFGLRPKVCPSCKANKILELPWSCEQCLNASKKETFKLLDFLEFDLGVSTSSVEVCFSGNAGYHIRIGESAFDKLGSSGRGEIVDYLAGRGIMPSLFNSPRLSPQDPGWRGRIARFIRDLPTEDALFGKVGDTYEKRLEALIGSFSKKEVEGFLVRALQETGVTIDPAVTTDIHRIFRMPESLNNKTGLVKRECTQNLSEFKPMEDALAFPDEKKREGILVDICPKIELGGARYGPYRSEVVELPTFVGVYLALKGAAKFVKAEAKEVSQGNQGETDRLD